MTQTSNYVQESIDSYKQKFEVFKKMEAIHKDEIQFLKSENEILNKNLSKKTKELHDALQDLEVVEQKHKNESIEDKQVILK